LEAVIACFGLGADHAIAALGGNTGACAVGVAAAAGIVVAVIACFNLRAVQAITAHGDDAIPSAVLVAGSACICVAIITSLKEVLHLAVTA